MQLNFTIKINHYVIKRQMKNMNKNKRVLFSDGSNWYLVTEEPGSVFVTTA